MNLGNLLETALSLLPSVNFMHRHFTGSEVDEFGQDAPSYSEWSVCRGMVQPVQRSKYEDLGLDFSKTYINVWGSIPLFTAGVQKQPDQILWNGYIWNVTAVNEWNQYNGWVSVTAVQEKRHERPVVA
ncbi:MAG: hypothetical protein MJZ81_07335 [Bacteroidales bacterium]|nr:hypothetical protein [Bacteroidales bacterium]